MTAFLFDKCDICDPHFLWKVDSLYTQHANVSVLNDQSMTTTYA